MMKELAVQISHGSQVLVETIKNYNSYVGKGFDHEFNKIGFDLKCEGLRHFTQHRKPAVHATMGGLKLMLTHVFEWKRSDYP